MYSYKSNNLSMTSHSGYVVFIGTISSLDSFSRKFQCHMIPLNRREINITKLHILEQTVPLINDSADSC